MNRRTLLRRFAAIAAAVAVAPAVKAEAAQEEVVVDRVCAGGSPDGYRALMDEYQRGLMTGHDTGILIGGAPGWEHDSLYVTGDSAITGNVMVERATPNEITPGQIARMWNREVSRLYPSEKALT